MNEALSALVGVAFGALLTSWLTFRFQKALLDQQLASEEKSRTQAMEARKVEFALFWKHVEKDIVLRFLKRWNGTMTGDIMPRIDETKLLLQVLLQDIGVQFAKIAAKMPTPPSEH